MTKDRVKARQYWAARYNGDNGDLIVGRVKSVRTTGEVVLVNLLTDKVATKSIEVLLRRNKRVDKRQVDMILDVYKQKGKPAARAQAVRMRSPYEPRQEELPVARVMTPEKRKAAWRGLDKLTDELAAITHHLEIFRVHLENLSAELHR